MLPDERTTHSNALALPSDVEALVAAPGRGVAKPLVTFLRAQGINVHTATDADSAFEEAILHPPDVVLIDDRVPPAGGIELCQRLKSSIRTHFVPVILFALNDLRQVRLRAVAAGADAVFAPSTDAQERRTRLWALLRTRALFRQMERKQRTQGSEIVDRRRWLSLFLHDLQGSVATLQASVDFMARYGPPPSHPRHQDFQESIDDARSVFDLLVHNVRTVTDYERIETGQLQPAQTSFHLMDVAAEVVAELGRHAATVGRMLSLTREQTNVDRPILADRELIKRVVTNLVLHAMRRGRGGDRIELRAGQSDQGARLAVIMPNEAMAADKATIFDPHTQATTSSVGYGLGLATTRAVVELHEGSIWVEDVPPTGSAFVFELKFEGRKAQPKRRSHRGERAGEQDTPPPRTDRE